MSSLALLVTSPRYILIGAAAFVIVYNLLHLITLGRTETVQIESALDEHIESSITPVAPHQSSAPKETRQVEFQFPEEGFPSDSLKYDINGQTSLDFLLKAAFGDKGKKDDGREFLKWNKYCRQNRFCVPSKVVQTLYRSDIGCDEIMPLLEKVRTCVESKAEKCEMILNHGFWRNVYAIEFEGRPVVLKSLKAEHVEPRNYLRQIRETIALDLVDSGSEWVVQEMGHCTPDEDDGMFGYTSMVPQLRIDLEEYLTSKIYQDLTLDHALSINIMCAAGIEAIHGIPGGPFVHNDLQPRQYLVTDDGRVLLNDLNRGKFLGHHEKTGERCGFCGSKAKGRWRSPEELNREILTHKLDIFSLGSVLWTTYAWGEDPFAALKRTEAMRKIRHGFTPEFTKMTPPDIRDIIQDCWKKDPEARPEAKEIVKRLNDVRKIYVTNTNFHDKRLIDLDFDSSSSSY